MEDFRVELYAKYVSRFKSFTLTSEYRAVWRDIYYYRFLPLLKDRDKDEAILELGCGPGYFLEFLKEQGFTNAKGVDISKEQVEVARQRGVDAKVADIFEFLDSSQDNFDVIIAIDFIEHFTREELLRLFSKIYQMLNDNGLLVLQTPNGMGLFSGQVVYGDLTHLTIFNPGSLEQILKLWGFHNFKFYETSPIAVNYKGKVRLYLWKLITYLEYLSKRIETGKVQKIWTENFICVCEK